ncbi:hypothetical protein M1293_02660 [Candidatus Parvarchaeota archaeon]|nr:hypothetical protein [Candidatus Parvarchaeota archaeon]
MMSKIEQKGAQSSVEYLIVIGIALVILSVLVSYSIYYSVGYNSQRLSQETGLSASGIGNAVNYLNSEEVGSSVKLSITSPGFSYPESIFCGDTVVLASNGAQSAQNLVLNTIGELPLDSGTYTGVVSSFLVGNTIEAVIRLNMPISLINSSYYMSPSDFLYNVSFLDTSGNLVGNVNFTVYLYTHSYVLVASQNETTISGSYSGSIPLSAEYSSLIVVILARSFGVFSSTCFSPNTMVEITLSNYQSSPTAQPFQQMVTVDSADFSSLEASNLSNIGFFYSNGTIIPSWMQNGNSAYFNGSSTYLNAPENTPVNPDSSLSVAVWFETTSDGVIVWDGNTSQPSTANAYSPILYVNDKGNLAGGDLAGGIQPFNTTYHVADGKWHLVVITQTTSGQSLYLDGNLIATVAGAPQSFSPYYWTIGEGYTNLWANTNNGNFYFNGFISDVQIYSVALSQSNVSTLYSEGINGNPISQGLAAWWPLLGNVNDYSGNSHNLAGKVSFLPSSGSSSTTYWLKVKGIPAFSSENIYMGFAPETENLLNNKNTGEAPSLSSTYGEYDDGANVFIYYTDFAGTSLPSGWGSSVGPSSGSVTVNNGVTLISGTGGSNGWGTITYQFAMPSSNQIIVEVYGQTAETGRQRMYLTDTSATSFGGYGGDLGFDYGIFGAGEITSGDLQYYWNGFYSPSNPSFSINTSYIVQYILTDSTFYWNILSKYGTLIASHSTSQPSTTDVLSLIDDDDSGATQSTYYWVEFRAYPPNGIMPSVSFSSV